MRKSAVNTTIEYINRGIHMGKVFEDYLSEIQKEMLSVCLEYAGHKVDRVFVYASYENNVISSDFFFEVNHKIWEKNRLKDIDQTIYDSSVKRQFACLDELERDIEGIISLCKEYDQPVPTEIRLFYDVHTKKAGATYQYDPVVAKTKNGISEDVVYDWIEEERSKLKARS